MLFQRHAMSCRIFSHAAAAAVSLLLVTAAGADPGLPAAASGGESAADDASTANMSELFSPVRSLKVDGPGSLPPLLPEGHTLETLDRPDDLSEPYGTDAVPVYYTTIGYGITRAPRNTHLFTAHPLYFEDANLERCGRGNGIWTPARSAVHLAAHLAALPLAVLCEHPDDCVRMLPDCPAGHRFSCDARCSRRCRRQ